MFFCCRFDHASPPTTVLSNDKKKATFPARPQKFRDKCHRRPPPPSSFPSSGVPAYYSSLPSRACNTNIKNRATQINYDSEESPKIGQNKQASESITIQKSLKKEKNKQASKATMTRSQIEVNKNRNHEINDGNKYAWTAKSRKDSRVTQRNARSGWTQRIWSAYAENLGVFFFIHGAWENRGGWAKEKKRKFFGNEYCTDSSNHTLIIPDCKFL